MERVILGRTGIEVNRLGLGGIAIQRVEESQAVETVLYAVEKGIDFIDTARAYSTSEERIGKALAQTPKRVIVASKSQNRTADGVRTDLERSIKELQREHIDLYQCHFVKNENEYDQVISSAGAFHGLLRAKEEGLIGHIGITTHSLDLLDRILDDGLFETIMACFSFLEPVASEKIIPKAIKKGVGVIAMKPFSGGVIENARLALKFVLSQPGVVAIAGVEHKRLFDENWEIFQGGHGLSQEEQREIEKIRKAYDRSFCRRCDYCQPCPEDIPIEKVIRTRLLVKKMGKQALTERRLKHIKKARNCTGCGECMTRCPYELPIPELIKETFELVGEQMRP